MINVVITTYDYPPKSSYASVKLLAADNASEGPYLFKSGGSIPLAVWLLWTVRYCPGGGGGGDGTIGQKTATYTRPASRFLSISSAINLADHIYRLVAEEWISIQISSKTASPAIWHWTSTRFYIILKVMPAWVKQAK